MARSALIRRLLRLGGPAAAALGLLAGCTHCKDCRGGKKQIPGEVSPAPLGTYAKGWADAQAVKAEASEFVFYIDEWYMGGSRLGPHGVFHLRKILPRLAYEPFPVVIQPDLDDSLNEARRVHLVETLLSHGVLDADRRVVIEIPQAEGLYGDEAERIYYDMIQRGQSGRFDTGRIGPWGNGSNGRPFGNGPGAPAGFAPVPMFINPAGF